MKDRNGTELNVGDRVYVQDPYWSVGCRSEGIIESFCPAQDSSIISISFQNIANIPNGVEWKYDSSQVEFAKRDPGTG